MQSKFVITGILLLFVAISVVVLIAKEMPANTEEPIDPVSNEPAEIVPEPPVEPVVEPIAEPVTELPTDGFVAYYFHGYARCRSCITIESLTDQTIHENFSDELENGSLAWRVVNTEASGNEHFVTDYELYTKSVVLAEFRDGSQVRWKNLDRVWRLLNDEEGFREYIRNEVAAFLSEG